MNQPEIEQRWIYILQLVDMALSEGKGWLSFDAKLEGIEGPHTSEELAGALDEMQQHLAMAGDECMTLLAALETTGDEAA